VCWSATADVVVGSAVVVAGAVAVLLAGQRRDVPLAALPVLLGAEQLLEAQLWGSSPGEGAVLTGPAVTLWVLVAFALLPVFVPFALLLAERRRRGVQWVAAAVGVPVAVVMAVAALHGATATDHGHVLDYGAGVPLLPLVLAGYLVAVCVPFLTSPEPTMRELGAVLVVGAAAAGAVDLLAFASVWCAFAAVVSLVVLRRTRHAALHLRPELV
jgi:hypothetical protein